MLTIVISAALGALVAGGFAVLTQWLVLREQQKQAKFTAAMDLAKAHRDLIWRIIEKKPDVKVEFHDMASHVVDYYAMVDELWDTGRLTPELARLLNRPATPPREP